MRRIRLTSKKTQNGKISSPYEPDGTDNHYAIQYKEIMQCSVEFLKSEYFEVEARVVDWDIKDKTTVRLNFQSNQFSAVLKDLPFDLQVQSEGILGTPLKFKYGSQANPVSYFAWNSNSEGAGQGVDGNKASRFCKVTTSSHDYNPSDKTATLGIKPTPGKSIPPVTKSKTPLAKKKVELTKCFFICFKVKI
jgi:hypothetical protein